MPTLLTASAHRVVLKFVNLTEDTQELDMAGKPV